MTPLLSASNLSKAYPGVQALESVSIEVFESEVLAVVGENGAGKSTLMKILAGAIDADEGFLTMGQKQVKFNNIRKALDSGVALIHQELNLAEDLSIASNLFLGHEPERLGFVNSKSIRSQSKLLLSKIGLEIDPNTKVSELPIGKQQLVEIARALSYDAKLLIFDEPTSSLSQSETETLFSLISELKEQGIGIVYISHRLNEVLSIADRVMVLKDGAYQGELKGEEISKEKMVSMMVGRDLDSSLGHSVSSGEILLQLDHVSTGEYPKIENSFSLRCGEILGLAGLVGAGRTSLLEGLFGVRPFLSGQVSLEGQNVEIRSAAEGRSLGMGLIPEDRKLNGLLLEKPVGENVSITSLARDSKVGFLNSTAELASIERGVSSLGIKTKSPASLATELSGGNQQKIVIAKWLELDPLVLLMDEPTRGVDVGAKKEIYDLMKSQTENGRSILFASSDLEELLRVADRILVVSLGRIVASLNRSEMSEETIMRWATEGDTVVA